MSITVHGADQLARTLRDAGDELADLTDANRHAGDVALAAARPPVRTGRLAASLTSQASSTGVSLTSPLVYAGPIHNGWPAHNIRANPFLANAIDQRTDKIVDVYAGTLDDALDKVRGA